MKLKIESSSKLRKDGIPSYAVQLGSRDGLIPCKACDIMVYASTGSQDGPKLRVCIYHDTENPDRFPPLSPPRDKWLCVKLSCSDAVLQKAELKLAEILRQESPAYRRRIVQWRLDKQEERVLNLAINIIGNGGVDGPLRLQPWNSFLTSCNEWSLSQDFERSKERRRRKKKPSGKTQGSTGCEMVSEGNQPS